MSVSQPLEQQRNDNTALIAGTLAFVAIAVIGLFIVKWNPYWHKAHLAAATHSIGASIVSGKDVVPPAVGLKAAVQYSLAYFNSVWMAVVLALLLGATVQVLVPRRWIMRFIGAPNAKSAAIAGAISLGGMM